MIVPGIKKKTKNKKNNKKKTAHRKWAKQILDKLSCASWTFLSHVKTTDAAPKKANH